MNVEIHTFKNIRDICKVVIVKNTFIKPKKINNLGVLFFLIKDLTKLKFFFKLFDTYKVIIITIYFNN